MTAGEKWRPGSHFLLHPGLSSASERRAESQSSEGEKATIPHVSRLHTWLSNFTSHRLKEQEKWGDYRLGSLVSADDNRQGQNQTPWSHHGDTCFLSQGSRMVRTGDPWVSVGSLGLAIRTALASPVRRTHASRGRAEDLLLRLLCRSLQVFPPRGVLLPFFLN